VKEVGFANAGPSAKETRPSVVASDKVILLRVMEATCVAVLPSAAKPAVRRPSAASEAAARSEGVVRCNAYRAGAKAEAEMAAALERVAVAVVMEAVAEVKEAVAEVKEAVAEGSGNSGRLGGSFSDA
jgi:mRNA-degrading endonuclease toxin of MazEF toxin-antitoxin module